eukprot:RCo020009
MATLLLSVDTLVCSFRFLGLDSHLTLRLVWKKFQELVDEYLAPEWNVVLRPKTVEDHMDEQSGALSLRLACSAGMISVQHKRFVEHLLGVGAEMAAHSASCLFPNLKSLQFL